jgi:hypothetical protein
VKEGVSIARGDDDVVLVDAQIVHHFLQQSVSDGSFPLFP